MKSSLFFISAVICSAWSLVANGAESKIFSENFDQENCNWQIALHRNRLHAERKLVQGKKALVISNASKKNTDTAFIIKTPLIPVPDTAHNYELSFLVTGNLKTEKFYGGNKKYVNHILFYDEDGELLESRYFRYFSATDKYRKNVFKGKFPTGTAAMVVSFAGDYPDIKIGQYMAISEFAISVK